MPPEVYKWARPLDHVEASQRFYLKERLDKWTESRNPKGVFALIGTGHQFSIPFRELIRTNLKRVEVVSYDYLQGQYERFHVFQSVPAVYGSIAEWMEKRLDERQEASLEDPEVVCCLAYPCQSTDISTPRVFAGE